MTQNLKVDLEPLKANEKLKELYIGFPAAQIFLLKLENMIGFLNTHRQEIFQKKI